LVERVLHEPPPNDPPDELVIVFANPLPINEYGLAYMTLLTPFIIVELFELVCMQFFSPPIEEKFDAKQIQFLHPPNIVAQLADNEFEIPPKIEEDIALAAMVLLVPPKMAEHPPLIILPQPPNIVFKLHPHILLDIPPKMELVHADSDIVLELPPPIKLQFPHIVLFHPPIIEE